MSTCPFIVSRSSAQAFVGLYVITGTRIVAGARRYAFAKAINEAFFQAMEVDDFLKAIRDDTPVTSGNSHDALRVMQLIDQIYRRGRQI